MVKDCDSICKARMDGGQRQVSVKTCMVRVNVIGHNIIDSISYRKLDYDHPNKQKMRETSIKRLEN